MSGWDIIIETVYSFLPLPPSRKQDLLSQKVAGGYRAVECEGEVGKNVVNAGDDFTVETALEDLEFGFSITTSKQRVSYNRDDLSPKGRMVSIS